jgi:hypothetical protein
LLNEKKKSIFELISQLVPSSPRSTPSMTYSTNPSRRRVRTLPPGCSSSSTAFAEPRG